MFIGYNDINKYLESIVINLDIPDEYYEKAEASYRSFATWLERDNSTVIKYKPEIFLQGSFKLGTVIRPIIEGDSYDIDLVCKFNNLNKNDITQNSLKELIGDEVKQYSLNKRMVNTPKNGKRCWTIYYRDEANFHIDILPCLNDTFSFMKKLQEKALDIQYKEKAIAITDKNSPNFEVITDLWETSNPQGYFSWFREKSSAIQKRAMLAEHFQMKVEDLPEYKVKSPLQRVIQILKRHRDIMFENDLNNRPSSIIITTLAAHAYDGSEDIKELLKNTVLNMPKYIEIREGSYYVSNPVNPLENFAEKWNVDPRKKQAFDSWLKQFRVNILAYDNDIKLYSEDLFEKLSKQLKVPLEKTAVYRDKELIESRQLSSIPHRQKPQWTMNNSVKVLIHAYKRRRGFDRPKLIRNGELLNKDTELKFEAIADNIKSYDVYWQITNTGEEAKKSNCLRGDFYDGSIEEGKRIRKESTMYVGSHIVECYIVKGDVCYGKSDPFIINIIGAYLAEW